MKKRVIAGFFLIMLLTSMSPAAFNIQPVEAEPQPSGNASAQRLVVRGLNNRIYYNTWNGSVWEGWARLPSGTTCDSPAAAILGDELHIVVRGFSTTSVYVNRSLYHGSVNLTTGIFSGWTRLSGATESAPTLAASEALNSLCLVVRGLKTRICYNTWNGTGWEGWMVLPSGLTCDAPAAAILGEELHIVVRDANSTGLYQNCSLWHGSVSLPTGVFSGWTRLLHARTPSAPTLAASQPLNSLYLVVRGLNNRIYHNTWNGSDWGGWTALPSGATCDTPAATMMDDEFHIVVRGTKGKSLWHYYIDLSTSDHSGWTRISGSTPSAPTLTS